MSPLGDSGLAFSSASSFNINLQLSCLGIKLVSILKISRKKHLAIEVPLFAGKR